MSAAPYYPSQYNPSKCWNFVCKRQQRTTWEFIYYSWCSLQETPSHCVARGFDAFLKDSSTAWGITGLTSYLSVVGLNIGPTSFSFNNTVHSCTQNCVALWLKHWNGCDFFLNLSTFSPHTIRIHVLSQSYPVLHQSTLAFFSVQREWLLTVKWPQIFRFRTIFTYLCLWYNCTLRS